eukprot:2810808-Amphidinium_carterae.1
MGTVRGCVVLPVWVWRACCQLASLLCSLASYQEHANGSGSRRAQCILTQWYCAPIPLQVLACFTGLEYHAYSIATTLLAGMSTTSVDPAHYPCDQ